jgi:hypothetical protein
LEIGGGELALGVDRLAVSWLDPVFRIHRFDFGGERIHCRVLKIRAPGESLGARIFSTETIPFKPRREFTLGVACQRGRTALTRWLRSI